VFRTLVAFAIRLLVTLTTHPVSHGERAARCPSRRGTYAHSQRRAVLPPSPDGQPRLPILRSARMRSCANTASTLVRIPKYPDPNPSSEPLRAVPTRMCSGDRESSRACILFQIQQAERASPPPPPPVLRTELTGPSEMPAGFVGRALQGLGARALPVGLPTPDPGPLRLRTTCSGRRCNGKSVHTRSAVGAHSVARRPRLC